jgi:hypothetical protein
MYASRLFAITLAVAVVVTFGLAAYTYGGTPQFVTVAVACVVGFAFWIATTYRRPPSRPAALDLYVATLVALTVLYAEQWSRGFSSRLMQLYPAAYPTGVGLTDHAFVAVFPLAGSALLLLGGLTYYHGAPFGRFAAWFTFAWGATTALAVYLYPLFTREPAGLMPGAISAPLPLVTSLLGMRALIRREGVGPATYAARLDRELDRALVKARRVAR